MDPNEVLNELLALSHELIQNEELEQLVAVAGEQESIRESAILMAEKFQALDLWIRSGGFLPGEWASHGRLAVTKASRKAGHNGD